MAKKRTEPTHPLQLRIPQSVFDYLEKKYRRGGATMQLQALAGIVAYECLSQQNQQDIMQWATRIAEDAGGWAALLETVKRMQAEAREQQILLGNPASGGSSAAKRRLA